MLFITLSYLINIDIAFTTSAICNAVKYEIEDENKRVWAKQIELRWYYDDEIYLWNKEKNTGISANAVEYRKLIIFFFSSSSLFFLLCKATDYWQMNCFSLPIAKYQFNFLFHLFRCLLYSSFYEHTTGYHRSQYVM